MIDMTAAALIAAARASNRTFLSEPDSKWILASYGIPVPRSSLCGTADEVGAALRGLRSPYALKVISSDVSHKSEVAGVRLNLTGATEVGAALLDMSRSLERKGLAIDGFLIEEMAPKGHEIVIGGTIDHSFGPAVMIGLGGIFVEVLKDVSFRLCPITRLDAFEMLEELQGREILRGIRGMAGAQIEAIVDVMLKVGGEDGLLCNLRNFILALDINPLIAAPNGVMAVDARMILREEG